MLPSCARSANLLCGLVPYTSPLPCGAAAMAQLKRQAKIQEQIRAKELQDQRIAMMDAVERAREEALEERSRIIQDKVNRMNTFMAKVRDKEAEDLAKAERERMEYEKEQDRIDRERKATARRRLQEQHAVLEEQIAIKRELEKKRIEYVPAAARAPPSAPQQRRMPT